MEKIKKNLKTLSTETLLELQPKLVYASNDHSVFEYHDIRDELIRRSKIYDKNLKNKKVNKSFNKKGTL